MAINNVDSPEPSNPLGVLIANIVGRLAFSEAVLRPISQYFYGAGMGGHIGIPVIIRRFGLSELAEDVRNRLPFALTNGIRGSEWEMAFDF